MLRGARLQYPILMGPRPHSPPAAPSPSLAGAGTSMATRRASAPYAEHSRGYFRTLSATSVGLEMAIAVVLPLLIGIWLDKKVGTSPWLMLVCLGFGFAAGLRGVWRYVADADREVAESEAERGATALSERAGGGL